ncbi:MAG: hypothetical protein WCT12_29170 [Verrucomicrobiota bacterium]|jgi:hypothetical protein
MNLREVSGTIEGELIKLFEELRSGMTAREDSRAFGAMIERRILDNWAAICGRCGYTQRVGRDAGKRIQAIESFKRGGYARFTFAS